MSPTTLAFMALAVGGLALLVTSGVRLRQARPDFGEFLDDLDQDDVGEGEYHERLSDPLLGRVFGGLFGAVSARLERFVPSKYIENLERQLVYAGLGGKRRAGEQVARQAGLGLVGAALVPFMTASTSLPRVAILLLPVMGFMVPSARLKRAIAARSDAIFKDLPDIIDMLAISVEAGSGFEAAISTVCTNFDSPLTDELKLALQGMELGLPRRDAFHQLRDRVDVPAVRTLVLSLLQADALGIPIGRVLKSQAIEVRARRRAWAREKAAKLPVKIMFPLVLFIFPPIMALVLGPAAFTFSQLSG